LSGYLFLIIFAKRILYKLKMNWIKRLFKSSVINDMPRGNNTGYPYRNSYDFSTKEFEVLRITYSWFKYDRVLNNIPTWNHYKYYKNAAAAYDAVRDFRRSWYDKAYYDYPALNNGVENEIKYPHIKPTITIFRYKVVRRIKINN